MSIDLTDDPLGDYVRRVTGRDMSWRKRAACAGSSQQVIEWFTCLEDDQFEVDGVVATGLQMQQYLVDTFCHQCPVQWECARWGIEVEEEIERSGGVWAMTRRDRRWLAKQPNPLSIVDRARVTRTPVHTAVSQRRLKVV